ncbi:hypothetical protein DC094_00260 [Pelagibaculum spongiae]|uniref:LysR substrate-binding domain-containing protein n=1 Tax=Pelagibaculum spongiae TaxID=2080658 RepID=A0A2V1GYL1_9GAMM|nr:hypothetical protein DC094_00260 [Pelagibaculum spongiae]
MITILRMFFYEDSVDVAFRFGDLKDFSRIAKRPKGVDMIFSTTPEYIEQKGMPRYSEDLIKHDMLGYRG